MEAYKVPDDLKEQYRYAIQQARANREKYFERLQNEIDIAVKLINRFDKIHVIGGIGARLIKTSPTFFNQFLVTSDKISKDEIAEDDLILEDEEVELVLEYLMSIATATPNLNKGVMPSLTDIDLIREQLSKIKANLNIYEVSADIPTGGNEADHWLRTVIMQETINVRGDGYQVHIREVYYEVLRPFDGFLEAYYGFNSEDIYNTLQKLDKLVYSKVGNPFGATQSHERFLEWMAETGEELIDETMAKTGKHFIRQFTEVNPDLFSEDSPDSVISYPLDSVSFYNKLFWVIPKSQKESLIFEKLSLEFGANGIFTEPVKYKYFPLNDTKIKLQPLIKQDGKYYHFSLNLAFRNIFKIVENLIKSADEIYYENSFKGNSNSQSRDNYIEVKTKNLFQKLLPDVNFFHSLKYEVLENNQNKKTELDILGISNDALYIIEVKAGELNNKHKRGALKGLKDRLSETINEGSYQCHRALKYIIESETPVFTNSDHGKRETISIDKSRIKNYFKISVTLEHFSTISANLKYLIRSGVLSSDFKWTWIVSLYDLMIFVDILKGEKEFQEYLLNRIDLYNRNDTEFLDEIDILGFYLKGNFPLGEEQLNKKIYITGFKDEIDKYYTQKGVGLPDVSKPEKK